MASHPFPVLRKGRVEVRYDRLQCIGKLEVKGRVLQAFWLAKYSPHRQSSRAGIDVLVARPPGLDVFCTFGK